MKSEQINIALAKLSVFKQEIQGRSRKCHHNIFNVFDNNKWVKRIIVVNDAVIKSNLIEAGV